MCCTHVTDCRAQDEQRKSIISQLLTSDAVERLSRIALVKPDNAKAVENAILMQYQQGRLQGKIDENQLKALLSQVSGQSTKTTVQINRRRYDDEDEKLGSEEDED